MNDSIVIFKKICSDIFSRHIQDIKTEIGNKKVLIYGAGSAYEELDKKFNLKELNVIGISDIKFTEESKFNELPAFPPSKIKNIEYDVILMTLFRPEKGINSLKSEGIINKTTDIKFIFEEIIPQEYEFLDYLEKFKFGKNLEKLSKKLKNKKVIIYGTGAFFQTINLYYDLSKLNIIAVSDKKFIEHEKDEKFLDYLVCSPLEIRELKPDCVLVATKYFINIIEDLEEDLLHKTKIKILPLCKKPFIELFNEIWN